MRRRHSVHRVVRRARYRRRSFFDWVVRLVCGHCKGEKELGRFPNRSDALRFKRALGTPAEGNTILVRRD